MIMVSRESGHSLCQIAGESQPAPQMNAGRIIAVKVRATLARENQVSVIATPPTALLQLRQGGQQAGPVRCASCAAINITLEPADDVVEDARAFKKRMRYYPLLDEDGIHECFQRNLLDLERPSIITSGSGSRASSV